MRATGINQNFSYLIPAIITALIVFYGRTVAADYQQGLDAYQKQQYDEAMQQWMEVVMSPPNTVNPAVLAETQYAVAMLFWLGQGVQQNLEAAARWLREAANLNHTGAQTKLGYLYLYGQGVQRSGFEAFKWMQMAAQQGDADAQYNLGVMYRDGVGVQRSPDQAIKWFSEAAAQGDLVSAGIVDGYQNTGTLTPGLEVSGHLPPSQSSAKESGNSTTPDATSAGAPESPAPPVELIARYGNFSRKAGGEENPLADLPVFDEEWINNRNPQHYTIQVVALKSVFNLQQLVTRHADMAPLAVCRQPSKGGTFYILLQGEFEDYESARQARDVFPESMQARDEIWIRRFSSIQEMMAKNTIDDSLRRASGNDSIPAQNDGAD